VTLERTASAFYGIGIPPDDEPLSDFITTTVSDGIYAFVLPLETVEAIAERILTLNELAAQNAITR
jgi:hypothetical protein